MVDEAMPNGGRQQQRRSTDHGQSAEQRITSDVARRVDLEQLENEVMGVVRETGQKVDSLGGRVDAMRDEVSGYVVQHAQLHSHDATEAARRWEGITAELAYKRGLISAPRLVLEWLRQYLPTVMIIGGLTAAIAGFVTGNIQVGVGQ